MPCCAATAMTARVQNPLLPHRNIDGCFSSVSGHTLCAGGAISSIPFAMSLLFIAPCLPTKAPHPPSG
jgi:hypothetical protein